jgi:hypothetical protein
MVRVAFLLDPGMSAEERAALERALAGARSALGVSRVSGRLMDWDTIHQATVAPVEITVRRNPYSEADECKCRFAYDAFPFDPRLARSAAVEAHIGDVGEARGRLALSEATRIFSGWADEGDWEAGDKNTIELRCRDNTALLIDERWSGHQVDLTKPLDQVLRAILDRRAPTRRTRLEFRGTGTPTLADLRTGDTLGTKFSTSPRDSDWDVITRLCNMAGLVCWMDGGTLVVAPGQTVTTSTRGVAFIQGVNLGRLRIRKAFGVRRSKPVLVRSWNPTLGKTLTAIYPDPGPQDRTQPEDEAALAERSAAGASVAERIFGQEQLDKLAKVMDAKRRESGLPRAAIEGVEPKTTAPPPTPAGRSLPTAADAGRETRYVEYDLEEDLSQAALEAIARRLYRRRADGDIEIDLETQDMRGPRGEDLTQLRAGDPVRLEVSATERAMLHRRDVDGRRRFLEQRGYAPRVADSIAHGYEGLENLFQVIEAETTLGSGGYRLRVRGINYIKVGD